jgi:hypothetical protein
LIRTFPAGTIPGERQSCNFVEALVGDGVNDTDRRILLITVADVDTFRGHVVSQVVHIGVVVDRGDEVVAAPIVDIELAFPAGDKELIYPDCEGNPLWFRNAWNAMHCRSLDGIYHFDRVIRERRNKDPPRLRGIETEMVEPPVNVRERYLCCQDEWTTFLLR